MTLYAPDVDEEDFGDLEESEDNGSQGGCSSSDNGSQGGVRVTLNMRSTLAIWEGEKRTNPPLGKGPGRVLRIMGPSMNIQVIGVG